MWIVWTGAVWVELDESMVEETRSRGYECRYIQPKLELEEESRDPTVFPTYCQEGFVMMERYLSVL